MNYEKVLNSRVVSVPPSGIRKFFDIAAEMKDCISLGVGEPDFVTPWSIRESAIKSLKAGHTYYTSNAGILELRELICRYYRERFCVEYTPDRCIITVGASEAIDMAVRALVEPGDEVIIPEPAYVSYAPAVSFANGVPVPLAASSQNGFIITADMISAALTPKTKAIIVPFPNNPTGAVMTAEQMAQALEPLKNTDVIVIADEIYAELTYGARHSSVAALDGFYDRTIVINGFSKAFAMTGWRLGYVMGPKPIIAQMLKIHQLTMLCAPIMCQEAGIEALRNGFENDFAEIAKMRREYNRRRLYLLKELNAIGLTCFEPRGAFYVFPSIACTGLTSDELCGRLLYEKKLAVVPGTAFGSCGEGFVRISYAYSMEHLMEAIERLSEFLRENNYGN